MRGAAVLLAVSLADAASARGAGFTFRDAEFMSPDRGLAAAQRFVSERFPPGLPLDVARSRAAGAAMTCRPPRAAGAPDVCRYAISVHADGGVIGEDAWTLRLVPDAGGALAAAQLSYYRGSGAVE